MSARFVTASTQYLRQTSAVIGTNTPWTVGLWAWVPALPGAGVAYVPFSLGANAAVRVWETYIGNTGQVGLGYWDGAQNGYTEIAGGFAAGVWAYIVVRSISTTNRRWCVMLPGAVNHAQNTDSFSTGALDQISIGATVFNGGVESPMTGAVAEFFYANADIQPGGAQLDDAMLKQLAHRGPFSMSHVVPYIVEYQSLRKGMKGRGPGDGYQAGAYRQWAEVAAPTIGDSPPLASDYVRPNQTLQPLLV